MLGLIFTGSIINLTNTVCQVAITLLRKTMLRWGVRNAAGKELVKEDLADKVT